MCVLVQFGVGSHRLDVYYYTRLFYIQYISACVCVCLRMIWLHAYQHDERTLCCHSQIQCTFLIVILMFCSTAGVEMADFSKRELLFGVTSIESYLDLSAQDLEFGFNETRRDRILRTYVRNVYHYHLNEIYSALKVRTDVTFTRRYIIQIHTIHHTHILVHTGIRVRACMCVRVCEGIIFVYASVTVSVNVYVTLHAANKIVPLINKRLLRFHSLAFAISFLPISPIIFFLFGCRAAIFDSFLNLHDVIRYTNIQHTHTIMQQSTNKPNRTNE